MTHYLIDGYNWLFRRSDAGGDGDLRPKREQIIHELSLKLSVAGILATLVFDSHFQPGPMQRLRSKGILICFTEEGQTADDYILEFVKYATRPQDYTVVTSDNRLAWAVRQKKGHSLKIPEFKKTLDRIYLKKTRPMLEKTPPIVNLPKQKPTLKSHYEKIFEEKLEDASPLISNKVKRPKLAKASKDCELISDYERWKRIFEGKEGGDGA